MIESGPLPLRTAYDKRWSASARRSGHAAQRHFPSRPWQRSTVLGGLTPNQLVGIEKRDAGNRPNVAAATVRADDNPGPTLELATFCGRDIKPEVGPDAFDAPSGGFGDRGKCVFGWRR